MVRRLLMHPAPELLPLFVKLQGRRVLVVGGGRVAAAKLAALRPTGARITVVAPRVTTAIRQAGVAVHRRRVLAADLDGAWLVVSAATPAVNRFVADAAESRGVFVNAVDDPRPATAYLAGVLRRDAVTIAVSTGGRAPGIAGLLREGLDALLPGDLPRWLETSDRLRARWRRDRVPMAERRPALLEALVRLHGPRIRAAAGGVVSLVGAGPGDPDLLTVLARARLEQADVVFHDGLVPPAIVRLAGSAERISVARRAGRKTLTQAGVGRRLVAAARRNLRVVRLKAGDPFVLGRGGEEAAALARAGVPVEIVPGLTSATAASALAGIPLTERAVASGFVVVSGHSPKAYGAIVRALPPGSATLVVLMGAAQRRHVMAALLSAGWPPRTPAAVIADASRPTQQVWTGPLATLGGDVGLRRADTPAVIVIGDVASRRVTSQIPAEESNHGSA
jgi:uroporphyrin-III C-methyltransferase/precorrin-2 dehydrogenase/sirohydrochlorin ferrochelatase